MQLTDKISLSSTSAQVCFYITAHYVRKQELLFSSVWSSSWCWR